MILKKRGGGRRKVTMMILCTFTVYFLIFFYTHKDSWLCCGNSVILFCCIKPCCQESMGYHGYYAEADMAIGHMTNVCKAVILSFQHQCCIIWYISYISSVLCSERFEWDTVDTILDLAREHLQGFAVIIVSSAEVKIFKGIELFLTPIKENVSL